MSIDITYTLPGFPPGNQRTETTSDGQPPEDGDRDCVPRSIASALTFLTGVQFNGDELHDAVYGQGYLGMQDAARYVDYCAAHGVALSLVQDAPAALIARAHREIAAGHPVLLTIPSQWGIPARLQPAGYTTHVVVLCGTGATSLRAMNPWIAPVWHDNTDAYWTDELVGGAMWIMRKAGGVAVWTKTATGAVDGHGHTVGTGFAALILAKYAQSDGRTGEMYYDAGKSYVLLSTAPYVLRWTQAGGVSETQAADVVIDLANQIAHLKAPPPPPPPPPPPTIKGKVAQDVETMIIDIIVEYEAAKTNK